MISKGLSIFQVMARILSNNSNKSGKEAHLPTNIQKKVNAQINEETLQKRKNNSFIFTQNILMLKTLTFLQAIWVFF